MTNKLRIGLVGDLMLGRDIAAELSLRSPDWFWGTTLPILKSLDAVFANLESPITEKETRWSKTEKTFYFKTHPWATEVLLAGNIKYVSLANDHILDFNPDGLFDTLMFLEQKGINFSGAGKNLLEARNAAFLDLKQKSFAVFSLSTTEKIFGGRADQPGINYLDLNRNPINTDILRSMLDSVPNATIKILSVHWAPGMKTKPTQVMTEFAENATNLGFDIVWGHGSHLLKAIKKIDRKLIIFEPGDFLDDFEIDPDLHNNWSILNILEFDGQMLSKVRIIPVVVQNNQVNLAHGELFEKIRQLIENRCQMFETPLAADPEGLAIIFD